MRHAAQMFTVRDHTQTPQDFQETLRKLREIGYKSVQLSAVGCMNDGSLSVSECRTMLDELGMDAPLTHRSWDEVKDRTDECIAFHQALGAELVAIGSIPGEYRSEGLDGYRRFVDDAEPVTAALKAAGLMFAYHNHAFEFERMAPNGDSPFDVMRLAGSRGLLFELDTYWVVHAGVDLVQLIGLLRGRVPMVHLKDKNPQGNEVRMAPVGEGNLSWSSILSAFEEAGTTLGAVEQDDCYGRDPFDCLASSLQYLER